MASNPILVQARVEELRMLSAATSLAYVNGLPYLVPDAHMTMSEVLAMLQYQMPTEHCLSGAIMQKIFEGPGGVPKKFHPARPSAAHTRYATNHVFRILGF
jgi:hypothetical protein